jgi:hypothetical protein
MRIALLLVLLFAAPARAELRYGLDFDPPGGAFVPYFGSPVYLSRMSPFVFTAPATRFVAEGAFAGRSEAAVRTAVRLRVEQMFRAVPAGPGRTLAITFEPGLLGVPKSRNIVIGRGQEPAGVLGASFVDTAVSDEFPDGFAGAVVFGQAIEQINPVTFDTFDRAINAIANVVAHEIGNSIGLEDVVTPPGGALAVMSTGALALPAAGWLEPHAFLTAEPLPDGRTQDSQQVLRERLGTVLLGDFDLDGQVNARDLLQASPFWQQSGLGFHQGDANGDGRFDSADLLVVSPNFGLSVPQLLQIVPEPQFLATLTAGAMFILRRGRRRERPRAAASISRPAPMRVASGDVFVTQCRLWLTESGERTPMHADARRLADI